MGAPNLIMQESGLTNLFGTRSGSWTCVNVSDVVAADPDVVIIVDATWDTALSKIDFLHNHSELRGARFIQQADYIKIPFSASTLGPRNGAAALDIAAATLHVTTGAITMNAKSGVDFFDPQVLADRTASLLSPIDLEKVRYSDTYRAPTSQNPPPAAASTSPSPSSSSDDPQEELPAWAIVVIAVLGVLFLAILAFVCVMYRREKQGKPIFDALLQNGAPQGQPGVAEGGRVVGSSVV